MDTTTKETRAEKYAEMGLTMSARFVPQSLSRNRDEKAKSLNWFVTLTRAGRQSMTVDYMQGIGHVPERPQSFDRTMWGVERRDAYDSAAERGTYPAGLTPNRNPGFATRKPLPPPSMDDVLYCLLLDAEAASETFENWCGNFGYDTDSRKAERMYNECVQTGIKLRNLLGGESVVQSLRELFQDY